MSLSQQTARGRRQPRGERTGLCNHLTALQRAAFPTGGNHGFGLRCILSGCPGLREAWCSWAAAWGRLQQCEPGVCGGDLRTSGPHPCAQGSHCRPVEILPQGPQRLGTFSPEILEEAAPLLKKPREGSPGLQAWSWAWGHTHSPLLPSVSRLCRLGQVTLPL